MKLKRALIAGALIALPIFAYAVMAGAFATGRGTANDGRSQTADFDFDVRQGIRGEIQGGFAGSIKATDTGDVWKLQMNGVKTLSVSNGEAFFTGPGIMALPSGVVQKGTIKVHVTDGVNTEDPDTIEMAFGHPFLPGKTFGGKVDSGDIVVNGSI